MQYFILVTGQRLPLIAGSHAAILLYANASDSPAPQEILYLFTNNRTGPQHVPQPDIPNRRGERASPLDLT